MLETKRERAIVFGGVPVAALLLYILLAGPGEEEADLAPAPRPVAAARPPAPISPPPPVVRAAAPPVAAPVPAAPAATSVTLAGVSGGGAGGGSAILAYGGGAQRIVAVGREVLPGVTLRAVRGDRIVLAGPGGLSELRVGGSTTGVGAASVPVAGNPKAAADAAARSYVRAAEPQRVGGRVVGYRVRSAGDIPVLARAGLQAGDILVSVNGNAIDGVERLTGIPAEIAGAASVDVEFVRAGRRMRAQVANQ